MKIRFVEIKNFRKLKSCRIDFDEKETIFVGANNSGKTSAMDALIVFLKDRGKITTQDFTISNWTHISAIAEDWMSPKENEQVDLSIDKWEPFLPQVDIWIEAASDELHYVSHLIPTLDWKGGLLGTRLRFEPKNIEELFKDFSTSFKNAQFSLQAKTGNKDSIKLWPKTMWDFLERKLHEHFTIGTYLLDPQNIAEPVDGEAFPQSLPPNSIPLESSPLKGLIKVDVINAQRGFSDVNTESAPQKAGNLSAQLREYYTKHLDPSDQPAPEDLDVLETMELARTTFDGKLKGLFKSSLAELQELNYPGFGNPSIEVATRIDAVDSLNHGSAVRFGLLKVPGGNGDEYISLPEKYNGLGYQNLISMVFKLIRFRDEWMQVGKRSKQYRNPDESSGFEPLHLVLIEEPEAHLHAQIQQVFIKKAYSVLRNHPDLNVKTRFATQLVVSTHSSHIAHEIEFKSLRYFKRLLASKTEIPISVVVNLSRIFGDGQATTKFAIRYLGSTHCDLFFADAAILIEGPAERMLVPHFIKHHFPLLTSCYLSILEVGGSHAHRLLPLIEELGLITLIITDIDSVGKNANNRWASVYPEKGKGYKTGNSTIKKLIEKKENLDDLYSCKDAEKQTNKYPIRVAFQQPLAIKLQDNKPEEVCPYTFEDALALSNIEQFRIISGDGLIEEFRNACGKKTVKEISSDLYGALKTENNKKAEFALELLFNIDPKSLMPPEYISEGLRWLIEKLSADKSNITGPTLN